MGKQNSYFFFKQEQRRLNPDWKKKSNQELMVLCSSLWNALSPQQKVRFEMMKKGQDPEMREKVRNKNEVRVAGGFDALGRPLVDIKKRDWERLRDVENKIEAVASKVDMGVVSLLKTDFYVIQTNVFVETEENPPVLVPAEISIAKFSLKEGVMEVYQAFMVPGKIPVGYKRLCLENSNDGHKIPLEIDTMDIQEEVVPQFKQTPDEKILQDITSFLSGTESVFCMSEKIVQCEGVLRTIAHRSDLTSPHFQDLVLA